VSVGGNDALGLSVLDAPPRTSVDGHAADGVHFRHVPPYSGFSDAGLCTIYNGCRDPASGSPRRSALDDVILRPRGAAPRGGPARGVRAARRLRESDRAVQAGGEKLPGRWRR
jgi:hypothetical protein